MKILGLLNSNAHGGKADIPREELFPNAMQAPLSKAIGEPVEVTARAIWPTPRLHQAVTKWLSEVKPDLVVFPISTFWFLYESTPVRMERRLKKPGAFIYRQSERIAATPWFAHNPVFQWGRRATQRVVGGDTWFEPEEVVASATEVIRAILRDEGSYLVVTGPSGGEKWAQTPEALERLLERRNQVDRALAEFCAAHHVEYWDTARLKSLRDPRPASLQGDELHLDREGHRRVVEAQFDSALQMVRRARDATRPGIENSPVVNGT